MDNATLYNQYFIRRRCLVGIKIIMQFLPLVGTKTAKVKGINSSQQDSSHSASFTKQTSVVILNINQLTTPNSLQKISLCVSLSNV